MKPVFENERVTIDRTVLGPWQTNCYAVIDRGSGESLVVDAPDEPEAIAALLDGTTPRYVLLTHNHPDHIMALGELLEKLNLPLVACSDDASGLPVTIDRLVKDGDKLALGSLSLIVLHTPGHTPGSLCLSGPGFLIAGDTVFPGGPGKTFSPEGFQEILGSIRDKLLPLPDDTVFLPGHGESGIIGVLRQSLESFSKRTHPAGLCGDVTWEDA